VSRGFLLDANVPSELARPLPEARVVAWVASQEDLQLSVISIGELRKGFSLLPLGRRRTELELWFDEFLPIIAENVLPVTQAIATRWGVLSAQRKMEGRPLGVSDGLIAATAAEHDLMIATRNVKDFAGLGGDVFNPWES
jgi:predicted nucleic acid-binding protein